jgi:glucose-6-phosphate isomerase
LDLTHPGCRQTEEEGSQSCRDFKLRFLSNVDPVDVARAQRALNPEETLVIVVSKSFATAETMLNARTMRQWLWDAMGKDPEVRPHPTNPRRLSPRILTCVARVCVCVCPVQVVAKHMAACASTSASELVQAFGIPQERLFPFWDWVGGRYSVCASPGALPICIKFGFTVFQKFLDGARSIDRHFMTAPMHRNIPVLMGLLGVWNMSFLGYKCRTIIPYAEALMKFPAHIQQVDMESNGKHTTVDGHEVEYDVGEIDFGEPGTNGQHSFFQLLHMGQVVPVDFIGFAESQQALHVEGEELSSHDELMANFFAQPDALAVGKTGHELRAEGIDPALVPHRTFKGNRPSLCILMPKLNAYTTGQLLAMYEHRTAVQGFVWNINSFDQWGVELGKQLAKDIRHKMTQARSGLAPNLENLGPATARMLRRYWRGGASLDQSASEHSGIHRPRHPGKEGEAQTDEGSSPQDSTSAALS